MSDSVAPVFKIRCKEKTSKGNVFRSNKGARKKLGELGERGKQLGIQAFRCPVCKLWHIGKSSEAPNGYIRVLYKNYRSERAWRIVKPLQVWYGQSEYHPGDSSVYVRVYDYVKAAIRDFRYNDILDWDKSADDDQVILVAQWLAEKQFHPLPPLDMPLFLTFGKNPPCQT